jgi:hypothetical protein
MNKITYLFFFFLFGIIGVVGANTIEEQKVALNIIADFADRLCVTVPLERGQTGSLELSGSGKAELNNLVNRIVSLGVEGAAKYQAEEWKGVLQKDLPGLIKDNINCKIEVWKDLKDRLIVSMPNSDLDSKSERLVISDDFETNYHWPTYPNHQEVRNWYDYGGFVVENVTENLSATWGFWKLGVVQPNAKLSIIVKQLEGEIDRAAGLLFGSPDTEYDSTYYFGVMGDGRYILLERNQNGEEKFIQLREDPTVHRGLGATNSLRVDIDGRSITYFINDEKLGRYVADGIVEGYIGVFLGWPGMKVVFDDLEVVEYF